MNLKIGAGIVLYNPDIELLKKNIESLYKQVNTIFLYDNGSRNIEVIKKLSASYANLVVKDGGKNRGIAYALNEILKWGRQEKFEWVLTMDQDSVCSKTLIKEYSFYLNDNDVALLCPFVLNNGKYTLKEYKNLNLPPVTQILDPVKCITSACLMNVEIVSKLGGFNDKLFIDCVDIDLNCRVLEANKKIIRVNKAYMIQQMGKGKKINLFEKLQFLTGLDLFRRAKVIAVYSDKRLYYYSRNTRYIRKKYRIHGKQTSAMFVLLYLLYYSVFYPSNRSRIKMWRAFSQGFKDSRMLLKE